MTIKSNFKDYYDFLQTKYGRDPLRIYVRHCLTLNYEKQWKKIGLYKPPFLESYNTKDYHFQMIAVAGLIFCVYLYKGKVYFGQECEALPDRIPSELGGTRDISNDKRAALCHNTKTTINDEEECPVLLVVEHHTWRHNWATKTDHIIKERYYAQVKNPRLADFQLGKCLDAEKCYLTINDFLSKEKPVIDNRTDKDKIQGHGFDKKYGFRTRPN